MKYTNWVILTGPPSSGKSTVAIELSRLGMQVVEDQGRKVFSRICGDVPRVQLGRDLEVKCQYEIARAKIKCAVELSPYESVFWDYGPLCSIPWMRSMGLTIPEEIYTFAESFRFREVFLFDVLPYVEDGVRTESEARTDLRENLRSVYRQFGYDPIDLPALSGDSAASVQDRVGRIVATLRTNADWPGY